MQQVFSYSRSARNERDAAENFVSALLEPEEFRALYSAATDKPYSFFIRQAQCQDYQRYLLDTL